MQQEIIKLEDGFNFVEVNISDVFNICGVKNVNYMEIFSKVYNMCSQKPPHNYTPQCYEKMKPIFINEVNILYKKLLTHHSNFNIDIQNKYKYYPFLKQINIYIRWMGKFFSYLDRFHTKRNNLPNTKDALTIEFNNSVFKNMFYENDYDFESFDDIKTKILNIENEWSKLIKVQQSLSLAKCLSLPNDILEKINEHIHMPSDVTILKSIDITIFSFDSKLSDYSLLKIHLSLDEKNKEIEIKNLKHRFSKPKEEIKKEYDIKLDKLIDEYYRELHKINCKYDSPIGHNCSPEPEL